MDLHHGAVATKILTKEDQQLLGLGTVVVVTKINTLVTTATATMVRHMALLQALLLPGSNKLLELRVGMALTLPTVPTELLLEWALLLASLLPVVQLLPLLLVLPQVWATLTPSSNSMLVQHLLPRRLLATLLHHLPVTSPRLLLPQETNVDHWVCEFLT